MSASATSTLLRYGKPLLHPYTLFLAICVAVWLPGGFNIGPVNDGWIKLSHADGSAWTAWIDFHSTEPFNFWSYLRMLVLASGGFQVVQLVLLVCSVLRAVLWYEVVKRILPGYQAYAIAGGLAALFHPFDGSYFWLGALGVHVAMLWALAFCVVALEHLRTGSRASLWGMYLLQFMTCSTYTGYLPLAVAVPVGAWILRWLEGSRPPIGYLLKVGVPIALFVVFQLWIASLGAGREGLVMDLNPGRTLEGYLSAGSDLIPDVRRLFADCAPLFLMMSIVPMILAYAQSHISDAGRLPHDRPRRPWLFLAVFAAGLLVIALLSFLPYAISTDRFGDKRQILAAGIFLEMAFLLLPFVVLPRYLSSRHLTAALLAVLTACTVVSGLEARGYWMNAYRAEAVLLGAVSAAVPNPPPQSVIEVMVGSRMHAQRFLGFYNRPGAFRNALQLLYGDDTLSAGFIKPGHTDVEFDADHMVFTTREAEHISLKVPYGSLIELDYGRDGKAQLSRDFLLQAAAQQHARLPEKTFGDAGAAPGMTSHVCSMLEAPLRPGYCR